MMGQRGAIFGDALRQAFMPKDQYEALREEDKAWARLQRPLIMVLLTLIGAAVVISVALTLSVVFPPKGEHAFCQRTRIQPLHMNGRAYNFTDEEAAQYFWMAVFLPTAILFGVSLVYLLAGIAVAYSAPQRHGCLKIVENNYCASKRGGVRCLATLNVSFAAVFVLLALFLGSTILTLESDCSVTLFWCYEVVCWGLVVIFAGTAFFLRRKAAVILDEGEYYGSHTVGLEMLEAAPQLPQAEIEKRVNAGFSSWMGSSFLSSDEEDGPHINGLDDIWEDDDAYSMPTNTRTTLP
ncbi:hypothetical protein SUGI_0579540 [Cryptomeria japonica]|uniref:uncharacterized protein LOC131077568 n=1 Tax=Cryptomeria japonica TaxID=3369 RepID=UPI002414AE29|nr:uncharacterized protein LOC131077568 [Cryptomeria japonica]GLJ29391.1 hypothetical protein SUGI_0579540 [Cryptomeria japonica]